ncbi:MAG TPA: preprotein translocase subunit SecG, partial [Gemmataceae bacterium]|nr:preprotein translocase subunit SecG [Gemmataceae bacterium]
MRISSWRLCGRPSSRQSRLPCPDRTPIITISKRTCRKDIAVSVASLSLFAVWGWVPPVLAIALLLVGLFLILLVLIQRGKGGGLSGAFGGAGGSSAFGS